VSIDGDVAAPSVFPRLSCLLPPPSSCASSHTHFRSPLPPPYTPYTHAHHRRPQRLGSFTIDHARLTAGARHEVQSPSLRVGVSSSDVGGSVKHSSTPLPTLTNTDPRGRRNSDCGPSIPRPLQATKAAAVDDSSDSMFSATAAGGDGGRGYVRKKTFLLGAWGVGRRRY